MTTVHEPILKIGTFGVHIVPNPAGTFSFVGTVPTDCAGTFADYDSALAAFIRFFRTQSTDWQRANVGNLRNDIFAQIFSK